MHIKKNIDVFLLSQESRHGVLEIDLTHYKNPMVKFLFFFSFFEALTSLILNVLYFKNKCKNIGCLKP